MLAGAISLAWAWQPSYWYDEAATLSAVSRSQAELLEMLNEVGAVNGLYYSVMNAWVGAFGASELATRSFSTIGIAVACGATAWLGDRLGGPRLGLAAGLIAAILPGLSWAGAEARVYAWNTAVTVIATLLLLRAVESGRTRSWLAYAAAMTVAGYLFLLSLLVILVHLAALGWQRRLTRTWWLSMGAVAVALIPLVWIARDQKERINYAEMGPLELVGKATLRQYFLSTRASDGLGIALICAVLLLAVSLVLVWAAVRGPGHGDVESAVERQQILSLAVPWTFIPTVVLVVYSIPGPTIYQERYLSFCAPGLALLLAYGLISLRSSGQIVICATLFVLLSLPILIQQKGENSRSGQDYRRLAEFAGDRAGAVIFADATVRSLRVAYPSSFDGLVELNTGNPAVVTDTFWGSVTTVEALRPTDVAGVTLVLVSSRERPKRGDAFASWLRASGCRDLESTHSSQLKVAIYVC